MSNNNIPDPLDELIRSHQAAANGEIPTPVEEPVYETKSEPVVESTIVEEPVVDYGENDIQQEMQMEDEITKQQHEQRVEIAKQHIKEEEDKIVQLAPNSLDPEFQKESIEYQADKLTLVSRMVEDVCKRYNIKSGGIPEVANPAKNVLAKFHVMGELVECYQNRGEAANPHFDSIVLNNWILGNDMVAYKALDPVTHTVPDSYNEGGFNTTEETSNTTQEDAKEEEKVVKVDAPTINVTVPKDGPDVTFNIDESIIVETNRTREVNIYVKEVDEKELKKTTIIENSEQTGIITPYESEICDTPVTLPMSGYRCVLRPINLFKFLSLSAPTSNNPSDIERKKWSVIYDQIKNVSIGEFKDFEDFLKKTKYQDRELLTWGILVATGDEKETLQILCNNDKCRSPIKIDYCPRTIIHLDDALIPSYYNDVHTVCAGEDAVKLYESISCKRTKYKLPNTGVIVEIEEPSAYTFINEKLQLVQEIFRRYKPDEEFAGVNYNDPSMVEFDYLSAHAMYVTALTIVKDGKEYRYTNWEDIENIITKSLDISDSNILLQLIHKVRAKTTPVSFYLTDVNCESCGRNDKRLIIRDIANDLLFHVSRRLASTNLNLINLD